MAGDPVRLAPTLTWTVRSSFSLVHLQLYRTRSPTISCMNSKRKQLHLHHTCFLFLADQDVWRLRLRDRPEVWEMLRPGSFNAFGRHACATSKHQHFCEFHFSVTCSLVRAVIFAFLGGRRHSTRISTSALPLYDTSFFICLMDLDGTRLYSYIHTGQLRDVRNGNRTKGRTNGRAISGTMKASEDARGRFPIYCQCPSRMVAKTL